MVDAAVSVSEGPEACKWADAWPRKRAKLDRRAMQAAMISDRYSELVGSKKSDDGIVDDYSRGARNRDGPEI